ncbi:MAG: HAMP domain-containing protein [Bacteroidales bacterium]|nr:HAMP domain-containing protein [Bacteroidales bacterium]
MKEPRFKYSLSILTAVMIIVSIAVESVYFSDFEYWLRTKRFNKVLREKEKVMDECLNGMEPILARGEGHGSSAENRLFSLAEKNRITLLEYIGDKLIYWSDNDFDVPVFLPDSAFSHPLIFVQNGWFLTRSIQAGNERIVGLLRLSNDYGFENDIIKNGFLRDFGITGEVTFSNQPDASDYHVVSTDGTFLFSIIYPGEKDGTWYFKIIPLLMWAITFLLLTGLTVRLSKYLTMKKRKLMALFSALIVFSILYLILLLTSYPAILTQFQLFSPYRYTMNAFIPTAGHLLVLSVLTAVMAYLFYRHADFVDKLIAKAGNRYLTLTILLIVAAILFQAYHFVFSHLILNSNINFETYKVLDLNALSLAGFVAVSFLFSVPFLYLLKVLPHVKEWPLRQLAVPCVLSLSVFFIFLGKEPLMAISLMVFYILVIAGIRLTCVFRTDTFNKSVIFSIIFGLYSLLIITVNSEKKTEEKINIQLLSYSTENDPTAEHLLLDIWPEIENDSMLARIMNVRYFEKDDVDLISGYLRDKYFHGYWGNFNVNVILCQLDDSLRIGETGEIHNNCFAFFEDRILRHGSRLTGSGFYYIDNRQGRANYLGRLFFDHGKGRINGLFIDIYSDINVFQPGYSELLLDKKYHSYARLRDYSFAKYINGELVLRTGDYPFNKTDAGYLTPDSGYRSFLEDYYRHSLYRNGNVTVVISRPALSFKDIIISFAYLFAFIFVFSNLLFLITGKPVFRGFFGMNFRQKLQMSFISILLVSFTIVGYVIASLAIRQYQNKHHENIREKLNSVYVELESRIPMERYPAEGYSGSNYYYLDEILIRLSNIFNTDINLYDLTGNMIATSRPEIFYRNLISRRMNNIAFINLANLTKSEYFQNEKIGRLEYISAYMPFYNPDNEVIFYLNLPYFRMQSVLARDISDMIVTVINFTLLLIVLAMSLAVFISSRLTAPLTILSSRLASVELGKKSEHLLYKGNDEVGDLVRQYNRMVDELDESAKKLAISEREYAWREMAKQIAHEIKNPLTPMKLNVQQLLKSWKDGSPGFEKKLERFTRNQIDFIDNLSSIATAFSSFAKLPEPKPSRVDLVDSIRTTLELFKNSGNISFKVNWTHGRRIVVFADREHINGIFSNLIKNGIQAIPSDREGILRVNMEVEDQKVVVSVADNGTGIPESLQSKMFTPNFTTKSSGAGLGLSIVKRYVESAGGKIWFISEPDKGTIFYIEFPLLIDDQTPVNQ